jgi:osmotically-inducible protein OsmY
VHSYGDRARAEQDVRRVPGVLGIANDIEVRLPLVGRKPDPEIAREAVAAFQREIPLAAEKVRVRVAEGRVTLEGEVDWPFERQRAEVAVCAIRGVRSVRNDLRVRLQILPLEIRRKIEMAFHRNAEFDADGISVDIADNGTVILSGIVHSAAEQEEAVRAAWDTPGIRKVESRLELLTS